MDVRRSAVGTTSRVRHGTGNVVKGMKAVTAVAMVLLVTVLSGCSGGGDGGGDGESAAGGGDAMVADDGSTAERGTATGLTTGALDATDVPARSVIKTGRVSLESRDLGPVRDEIDRLLGRYGGYVDNEETLNDSGGRVSSSTLQLRVPSTDFDAVLTGLKDVATVADVQQSAEDVTTEVIDVDARVRTAEVSLQRLRKFLGRAGAVDVVIRLESEIAEREAELASLRAQQRFLENQTSLATITVHMTRTDNPREDDPLADAGFLTGLRNGWQALGDVAVVAATVTGAALPFALVAGALLAPLALWLRTRRRRDPGRPVGPMAGPPLAFAGPGGPAGPGGTAGSSGDPSGSQPAPPAGP